MPSYALIHVPATTPTKISEVNPRRETLTVVNFSPHLVAIADNDQPRIGYARLDGFLIPPYSSLTFEREDGDSPDKTWWVYAEATIDLSVFEGMTEPRKRWW